MKKPSSISEKNQMLYHLPDCTQSELERNLDSFFFLEDYVFKSQYNGVRTYIKGNKTMRILFGALATYFEQTVIINKEEEGFSICLPKGSAGIFGGLVGKSQVDQEFQRINEALGAFLFKPTP